MALADDGGLAGRRLADFVSRLRGSDDEMRLRIVLHEFGLLWDDTPLADRLALVAEEPAPVEPRWDAFLAAYVEHRCLHDGITAPAWVFDSVRYLDRFWFPGPDLDFMHVEAIVHSPAAFEARRVFLPARELAPDTTARVVFDHPALRALAASPEHLLAMKAMAARRTDFDDLVRLIDMLGAESAPEVVATVEGVLGSAELPDHGRLAIEAAVQAAQREH